MPGAAIETVPVAAPRSKPVLEARALTTSRVTETVATAVIDGASAVLASST